MDYEIDKDLFSKLDATEMLPQSIDDKPDWQKYIVD